MKEAEVSALRNLVELRDDKAMLKANRTDHGHLVFREPYAVAMPKSAQEVGEIIQWANRADWPIAVRGAGHTMGGQSLVHRGIALNMRGLNRLGDIEGETIWVQGGVLWRDLVKHVLPHGYLPPVLTNNLHTTVGGTIAMSGVGRSSHRFGLQADNVEELEVVTGNGQLVRCSATENQALFDCTRCGVGQFSVITQARIRLRKVLPKIRTFCLVYEDLQTLLDDQATAAFGERFMHIRGWCRHQSHKFGLPDDAQPTDPEWLYPMHASVEFDAEPDQDELLEGLGHIRFRTEDHSALDFADLLEPDPLAVQHQLSMPMAAPVTEALLPWSAVFTCTTNLLEYIPRAVLARCNITLRPLHNGLEKSPPLLMRPSSKWTMGFGIIPYIPQVVLLDALPIFEKAGRLLTEHGGKRHLTGWVKYDHADWKAHYGEYWPQMLQWKERFDPKGLLNPGFIHYRP